MIQWSILRGRLQRTLGAGSFSEDDLLGYANMSLIALSAHTAKERALSYGALSGTASSLELPDDLLELGPLFVSYGTVERNLYRPYRLQAGEELPLTLVGNPASTNFYYTWGSTLYFLVPTLAGRVPLLHYYAYWDRVEQDDDILKIPRWMEEPIWWYSQHMAMMKPGASAARLRTFNTKQDSGEPEHNSLLKYSDYCLKRYNQCLNEQPNQDRQAWAGKV